MICLDKTKTNRYDQKKDEENTFFLLAFSWRPCCNAKETAGQNSKFQETSFTLFLLIISVLLYYKSHFRQACHLYSSSPLCVARTRILLAVFVIKFYPIAVRFLKDTSWKVVTDQITFTAISCKISTSMLKEMSRIKTSKNFMEHTSTSFSRRLFVCLI